MSNTSDTDLVTKSDQTLPLPTATPPGPKLHPEKSITDNISRRRAQEEAIRPMLLRANLLRLRGDFTEAVAVCAEALRAAPESDAALSLMGDIYEAQGRPDEAAQWFRMALDVNPQSVADQEKFNRVIAAQQAARFAEAAPVVKPNKERSRLPTVRTQEWIHRVLPPGGNTIARVILGVSFLLAVILACGGIMLSILDERAKLRLAEARATVPTPLSVPAPPAAESADSEFRAMLTRLLPRELRLRGASIDPRTMSAVSEAQLMLPAEELLTNPAQLRERVLQAATVLAHATSRAEQQLQRITVRVAIPQPNASSKTVFVGDVQAMSVRNIEPALVPYASQTALFADKWWSQELRPPMPFVRRE